jgi:hypothetical protein
VDRQLQLSVPADIAVNFQQVDDGVALHIIRYDYDFDKDALPALVELTLDVHLPKEFSKLEVFSPTDKPHAQLQVTDGRHTITLKDIPLYSILLLKEQ